MTLIYDPSTGEILAKHPPEALVEPGPGYAMLVVSGITGEETNISQIPSSAYPVPKEVPLWAFRASLELAGLKDAAQAQVDALTGQAKIVALQQWEYGNFIERAHPLINTLGQNLGLTSAQIDDIFRTAATLT